MFVFTDSAVFQLNKGFVFNEPISDKLPRILHVKKEAASSLTGSTVTVPKLETVDQSTLSLFLLPATAGTDYMIFGFKSQAQIKI